MALWPTKLDVQACWAVYKTQKHFVWVVGWAGK